MGCCLPERASPDLTSDYRLVNQLSFCRQSAIGKLPAAGAFSPESFIVIRTTTEQHAHQ
jgi:hypothetical protein